MAKDTKERILATALDLFSHTGYAGTNVRELTASLGMVKSSIYKHFESKEEIWNALLDSMIAYYDERFGSPDHLPPVPDSPEGLVAMTMRMVDFTIHDEKVIKTRKLLTIEQFRDERARALATKYFLTGLWELFTPIFAGMMDRGLLCRDDPQCLPLPIPRRSPRSFTSVTGNRIKRRRPWRRSRSSAGTLLRLTEERTMIEQSERIPIRPLQKEAPKYTLCFLENLQKEINDLR